MSLAAALRQSGPWLRFESARTGLSSEASAELAGARSLYWKRTTEDVLSLEAGNRLLAADEYRWHVINELRGTLTDEALQLWFTFEELNVFFETVWHVISHFAVYGSVRSVQHFEAFEWNPSQQRARLCVIASPFKYRPAMLVSVPPGRSPVPFCGIVNGHEISFRRGNITICMDLAILKDGWAVLVE